MIRFSLCVSHTPWREDRVAACREMLMALTPLAHGVPFLLNDVDYRGTDWQVSKVQWAMDQWRWALATPATSHHVFMTDDLRIAPRFWEILNAMVTACPDGAIGLLSNHPKGPGLFIRDESTWYRCNSWIVGPAYLVPRELLAEFFTYFCGLPDGSAPGCKGYGNDDSTLNEFLTKTGRCSYHPLPTIIEHRGDLPSTVGHGDRYSQERISWRKLQQPVDVEPGRFVWESDSLFDSEEAEQQAKLLERMARPDFWVTPLEPRSAPMLTVGQ